MPGGGNSRCKDPETGACLVGLKNMEEAQLESRRKERAVLRA